MLVTRALGSWLTLTFRNVTTASITSSTDFIFVDVHSNNDQSTNGHWLIICIDPGHQNDIQDAMLEAEWGQKCVRKFTFRDFFQISGGPMCQGFGMADRATFWNKGLHQTVSKNRKFRNPFNAGTDLSELKLRPLWSTLESYNSTSLVLCFGIYDYNIHMKYTTCI